MAAHRERLRAEQAPGGFERDMEIAREAYVAREVAITRAGIENGSLTTHDANGNDLDRLGRTERYARWRWAGFHAGESASL